MNQETKYRLFIDNLIAEISEAATSCFGHETDPEVSWKTFRNTLRTFKKEHISEYEKFLETDDETIQPESPIHQWRREHDNL